MASFCQWLALTFENMNQRQTFAELREQAIALRRAGRSRREIRDLLAITSNEILNEALRGEPPQLQNLRLNAKDEERHNPTTVRKNTGIDITAACASRCCAAWSCIARLTGGPRLRWRNQTRSGARSSRVQDAPCLAAATGPGAIESQGRLSIVAM